MSGYTICQQNQPFTKCQRLTLLRVDLSNVSRLQLLLCELCLLLHPLLVTFGQVNKLLHTVGVVLALVVEVIHLQCLRPDMLVQVHQHVLL
jgi:hypothetical protein